MVFLDCRAGKRRERRRREAEQRLRDAEERRLREEKARRDADEELARAARKGDEAAMARLLAEGASPDAKDWRGYPAAVLAARGGHCHAVTLLADAGADLGVRSPKGHTALAVATMWDHVVCVETLLGLSRGAETPRKRDNAWPEWPSSPAPGISPAVSPVSELSFDVKAAP